MENHEVDSDKETLRKEKLNADESKLSAQDKPEPKPIWPESKRLK